MRYFTLALVLIFSTLAYSRQIIPVTNAGYTTGLPMDFASTPDAVYMLTKLNGGSSADTMRYAVHKFNGQVWSQELYIACEPGAEIYCIGYWNNKIILGGMFHNLFGIQGAHGVIAYSNGVYHALGSGISTSQYCIVRSLGVFKNKLLAGGQLFMTTGSPCHPLAQFDGTTWSNFGGAFSNPICQIAMLVNFIKEDGNRLYIQGEFEYIDNVLVNHVAYFENGTYHTLGTGLPNTICPNSGGIGISGDKVFVKVRDASEDKIMMWDGSVWSAIMSATNYGYINNIHSENDIAVITGGSWNTGPFDAVNGYENNALSPFTNLQDYAYIRDAFTLNCAIYFMGNFKVTGDNTAYTFGKTSLCLASAIEAPAAENNVAVYPNPFSNTITVQSNEGVEAIRLYDVSGRVVFETFSAQNLHAIQTGNLTAGVYLLDITTAQGVTQRKLVKPE